MSKPIGVGIVGANPERGWAHMAHIPALRTMPEFRIAAVSTTNMESAKACAATLPASDRFDDSARMAEHPDVDLIAVTDKVPEHYRIAMTAIEAGKHVLCEWPLAIDTAQAERLLAAARERGVRHFIGLQGRLSPTVAYIRDLIAEGYIGDLLSCSIIGSGLAWGAAIDRSNAYGLDPRNAATLLTIPVGHLLDTLTSLLGPVGPVKASIPQRRTHTTTIESGEVLPLETPDQVLIATSFGDGIPTSIHYRGGLSGATNLHWELNGTSGDLVVSAATGHVQMSGLSLRGSQGGPGSELQPMPVPQSYFEPEEASLAAEAASVRRLYRLIAADIADGTSRAPDFAAALRCHEMLDLVRAAAR